MYTTQNNCFFTANISQICTLYKEWSTAWKPITHLHRITLVTSRLHSMLKPKRLLTCVSSLVLDIFIQFSPHIIVQNPQNSRVVQILYTKWSLYVTVLWLQGWKIESWAVNLYNNLFFPSPSTPGNMQLCISSKSVNIAWPKARIL